MSVFFTVRVIVCHLYRSKVLFFLLSTFFVAFIVRAMFKGEFFGPTYSGNTSSTNFSKNVLIWTISQSTERLRRNPFPCIEILWARAMVSKCCFWKRYRHCTWFHIMVRFLMLFFSCLFEKHNYLHFHLHRYIWNRRCPVTHTGTGELRHKSLHMMEHEWTRKIH